MNSKLRKVEPEAIANPKLASGVRGYTGYSGISNHKRARQRRFSSILVREIPVSMPSSRDLSISGSYFGTFAPIQKYSRRQERLRTLIVGVAENYIC